MTFQIEVLCFERESGERLYLTVASFGPTTIEVSSTKEDAEAFASEMQAAHMAAHRQMRDHYCEQDQGFPS